MGAEQIGYLVVGPRVLDVSRVPEAAERVQAYVDLAKKILPWFEDDAVVEPPSLNTDEQERYEVLFDEQWEDNVKAGTYVANRDVKDVADLEPKAFVETFVAAWPFSSARDVAYRLFPDDAERVIVFAGSMSWGDRPNGYGYDMLDKAIKLGLFPVFGIE